MLFEIPVRLTSTPAHHSHHYTPCIHCTLLPWANTRPVGTYAHYTRAVSTHGFHSSCYIQWRPCWNTAKECSWRPWCRHRVCLLWHTHTHCWSHPAETIDHPAPGNVIGRQLNMTWSEDNDNKTIHNNMSTQCDFFL